MTDWIKTTQATIIPTMRYRDAPAAIEWLCRVFGFASHMVVPGDNGAIAHAQLTFGNGMIMLGSVRGDETTMTQPDAIDGVETQAPYVIVTDADAVYESARRGGAEIVLEIADQDHGGRLFSCRDIEGHLWHFGSYDPWAPVETSQAH